MEIWLHAFSFPGRVAELARQAERWGFTGMLVADSQNLTADIWVELALAGAATSSLRLGPGVTNPLTRHIAVTASAASALQAETEGRATLGFAQGDSALSQIGLAPLSVVQFEETLQALQGLLRGEEVPLDGTTSAIGWIAEAEFPKVPLHVAATGPRTIKAAARHADGIDLTVGAEPERVRWGSATARRAAPARLSVGAYLNVAVDNDLDSARDLVRGSVATFARFSAQTAGLANVAKRGIARAASGYEKDRHGQTAAAFARRLDHEFVDRFAVCGSPQHVRERLLELGGCGIERLILVAGSLDSDREAVLRSIERFARQVLPELIDG